MGVPIGALTQPLPYATKSQHQELRFMAGVGTRVFSGRRGMRKRLASCNCGQVKLEVDGEPTRVGLCHCQVCRKETGSLGNFFAVWPAARVAITGETRSWLLATDHRHFCPICGSSVFATVDGANEVEVRAGTLDDAPTYLTPLYELWVGRREHWFAPVAGAEQHEHNKA